MVSTSLEEGCVILAIERLIQSVQQRESFLELASRGQQAYLITEICVGARMVLSGRHNEGAESSEGNAVAAAA